MEESADEYGRYSLCFRDHRLPPHCLASHAHSIRAAIGPPAPDGLLDPPADVAASIIPRPEIHGDAAITDESGLLLQLWASPGRPLDEPLALSRWSTAVELRLPDGQLDLGSVPDMDALDYLGTVSAKRNCSLLQSWLPLCRVVSDRDEALSFPPWVRNVELLLRRELAHEAIEPAPGDTGYDAMFAHDPEPLGIPSSSSILRKAMTPPLSPLSDSIADSPYVPGPDAAAIHPTSSPGSPVTARVERLRANLAGIDSDIAASLPAIGSSPPRACTYASAALSSHGLMMDVPIALATSDPPSAQDALLAIQVTGSREHTPQAACGQGFFEEALASILADCQSRTVNAAVQEQLSPSDGVSRVPVPVVDFEIAKPPWAHGLWTARQHLSWLASDAPDVLHVPCIPKDGLLDSTLRWAPVPRRHARVITEEALESDLAEWQHDAREEGAGAPRSARHVATWSGPAILDLEEEEEEEIPAEYLFDTATDDTLNADGPPARDEAMPPTTPPRSGSLLDMGLGAIRPSLRQAAQDVSAPLLHSDGAFSTGALLEDFMELRAVKRRKTSASEPARHHLARGDTSAPPASDEPRHLTGDDVPSLVPAPVPAYQMPDRKGPCIVSLALGPQIIRHLDAAWSSPLLIDRDFASGGAAASQLLHEADVCLTPTVGVIATSLTKVGQRALPGSKEPPPLRDRILKVGQKYEKLIILVSESNLAGEFVADLSPPDLASYADFARFVACLETDASAYLVPGASRTLAQWILALMCRHSGQTADLAHVVTPEETPWDVFFRRAGANAMAAQVLSRAIAADFGGSGLARFLVMPPQERSARYAAALGGQKTLARLDALLGTLWA